MSNTTLKKLINMFKQHVKHMEKFMETTVITQF
jgi:hypothetical protein